MLLNGLMTARDQNEALGYKIGLARLMQLASFTNPDSH